MLLKAPPRWHWTLRLILLGVLTAFHSTAMAAPSAGGGSLAAASPGGVSAFEDLRGRPEAEAIAVLAALRIVSGTGGGLFEPDRPITRAEMTKMVVVAFGIEPGGLSGLDRLSGRRPMYPDVPGDHWAKAYVDEAADLGIVRGYPDGTFRPQAVVSVVESLSMLWRSGSLSKIGPFSSAAGSTASGAAAGPGEEIGEDGVAADVPEWAAPAVSWARSAGLLPDAVNESAWHKGMSRAEAALLIRKCLGLVQRDFDFSGVVAYAVGHRLALVSSASSSGVPSGVQAFTFSCHDGVYVYRNGRPASLGEIRKLDEVEVVVRRGEDGAILSPVEPAVVVARSKWVSGVVEEIDPKARAVRLKTTEAPSAGLGAGDGPPAQAGLTVPVTVPDSCPILRNGRPCRLEDIRVGDALRAALHGRLLAGVLVARFADATRFDFSAVVLGVDRAAGTLTVREATGSPRTLRWGPDTLLFLRDGRIGDPGDLAPGDGIWVALDPGGFIVYAEVRPTSFT